METQIKLGKLDGCIKTLSGIKFDLINPDLSMIDIIDISAGLANKGHFSGQTPYYFSIAKHSILVYTLFKEKIDAGIIKIEDEYLLYTLYLICLLHDANEAYIGDMVKPLKVLIPKFQEIEDNISEVIYRKYDLFNEYYEYYKVFIKPCDIEAQIIEYESFYKQTGLRDENGIKYNMYNSYPRTDYNEFLNLFNQLMRERNIRSNR